VLCSSRAPKYTHNSVHPVLAAQDRRTHTAILPSLLLATSSSDKISAPSSQHARRVWLSRRPKELGAGQREQEVLTLELQPAPTLGRNEHVGRTGL
jgi:hypothetical protein